MADGTVTYMYNRFGQILSETWTKNGETTHRYKYVYDSDGQVVRVIDICNQREYNYYYRKGSTISRITESEVVLDENEIVTSKTPICTIYYRYNSADVLTSKRIEQGVLSRNTSMSGRGRQSDRHPCRTERPASTAPTTSVERLQMS